MNETILDALRLELLNRSPLASLPEEVWKETGTLNTYGTNAIEGNTLTQAEVETVLRLERGVRNRPLRDINETQNHARAFLGLRDRLTQHIDLESVLELHEEVFRGILSDAGRWRTYNVRIEREYTPPRYEKIVPSMERWIADYERMIIEGDPIFRVAAWMHFEFERIHPFGNGNGRVGRLILNLHFLKHNWPPVHILPGDRNEYMASLREGHRGDFSRLEEFLRVLMARSLIDLLDRIGTKNDELKPLRHFTEHTGYGPGYLGLRARQGCLPALKRKGDWMTSERAIEIYIKLIGRKKNN